MALIIANKASVYIILVDVVVFYSPSYWKADVDHLQCNEFFGKEEPCTLYLSFCQDITEVSECAGSTVCLTDGTTTYTFGRYNNYTNPFATSGNSLLLEYSSIVFHCRT